MAIIDNFISFFSFETLTQDSHGSNTLTDNNTVGQSATAIASSFAALFTASSFERLTRVNNASLQTGNIDFTWAFWARLAAKPTNIMGLVAKYNNTGNQREYCVQWSNTTDRFEFLVSNNGTAFNTATANSFGAPSTNVYYFIVAEHSAAADTISIQINDGTIDSTAHTTGVLAGTSTLELGARNTGLYYDGRMDQVGFWKRLLTTEEKTWLYNSGVGRSYAEVLAGMPAGGFIPAWASNANGMIQPGQL